MKILLYGLQRSGTNYLEQLLKKKIKKLHLLILQKEIILNINIIDFITKKVSCHINYISMIKK